jgi:hypothetical protein
MIKRKKCIEIYKTVKTIVEWERDKLIAVLKVLIKILYKLIQQGEVQDYIIDQLNLLIMIYKIEYCCLFILKFKYIKYIIFYLDS